MNKTAGKNTEINEYRVEDLIDIPLFQKLLDDLDKIFPFPSSIVDIEGNVLTATAWQKICTNFHRKHPLSLKECNKSDDYISIHLAEADPAITYKCPHGLIDSAIPLMVEGKHIATFFTGQFLFEAPDPEFFRKQAEKYGYDEKSYLKAVDEVPVWSEEKHKYYLNIIKSLTDILIKNAYDNLNESRNISLIKSNEKKYRTLFESMRQGVFYQSSEGKLLDINNAGLQIFGISKSEFLNTNSYDPSWKATNQDGTLLKAEDHPSMIVLKTGKPVTDKIASIYNPKEKRIRWLVINALPEFNDKDNSLSGVVTTMHDITDLINTEKRLQIAGKAAGFGAFHFNFKTGEYEYSDEVIKLMGLTPPEKIETDPAFIPVMVHPEDKELFREANEKARDPKGSGMIDFDFRIYTKDKEIRWLIAKGLCKFSDEKLIDSTGIMQDITRIKLAEQALLKCSFRLKAIVENNGASIWSVNDKYELLFSNTTFRKIMSGSTGIELKNGDSVLLSKLPENEKNEWKDYYNRGLKGESFKFERKRKYSNEPAWYEYHIGPIKGEEGKIIGATAIAIDITARKIAENNLLQSEEKYRSLAENSPDIIMRFDKNFRHLYANRSVMVSRLYQNTDFLGKSLKDIGFNQDAVRLAEGYISKVFETGKIIEDEIRFQDNDQIFYYNTRFIPEVSPEGSIDSVQVIGRNITRMKKNEESIRESEKKYRILYENAGLGILYISPDYRINSINLRAAGYFNVTPEDFEGAYLDQIMEKKEANILIKNIKRASRSETSVEYETNFSSPKGSRYLSLTFCRMLNSDNEFTGTQIIFKDISKSKKAEKALAASELKYHAIADNTFDWEFWETDKHKYIYHSPSCQRISGHPPEDFFRDPSLIEKIIHPDDRQKYNEHHKNETNNYNKHEPIEFRIINSMGEIVWIEHECAPAFSKKSEFLGIRGSNRDCSARKKAENLLLKKINELERFNNLTIDRELRMIDLKKEVNQLLAELGKKEKYRIAK